MDFRTPEELLGLRKKLPISPRLMGLLVMAFAFLLVIITMFYKIEYNERGVVLFLGKYIRTTTPGLHMKLPLGIETVTPVKVDKIFTEEFGFRTQQANTRTRFGAQNYFEESLMLTGDLNALDVTWIVQFKVKDPVKLLYSIKKPVASIRDISESVMRGLVGDYSLDEVLTTKREEISSIAKKRLQTILDDYNSGVYIEIVKLKNVKPPQPVQAAFNEVNEAKQEKERTINMALQAYNKVIPKARGQAAKMVLEAEAYAISRTNRAEGDANRFSAVLTEYRNAPEVTKTRLYLESLERIMTKPKEKFIMDSSQGALLPLLDFRNKESAS